MEDIENKEETVEALGIDHLLSHLNDINAQDARLSPAKTATLFRQMGNEIPYAAPVLHPSLASALLADTPLQKNNNTLNMTIACLGKAFFNPNNLTPISQLAQTYLYSRKQAEKSYASGVLNDVLAHSDLSLYPESAKPALKNLSQLILEKIINEKQSRKIPGYKPHSLIELIDPIIHNKLMNPELDKIKVQHFFEFRQFVNSIAHAGYEAIRDEESFMAILAEKQTAFNIFSEGIAALEPKEAELNTFRRKLWFSQRDKLQKHEAFMKQVDVFLNVLKSKKHLHELSLQLRLRFSENLRKKFNAMDRDTALYQRDESIKQAHESAFSQIQFDANGIRLILTEILAIEERYNHAILHRLSNQKTLVLLEDYLTDVLLGKVIIQRNPLTDDKRHMRIHGYPQKSIAELFGDMIAALETLESKLHGLFAEALKHEIKTAITDLSDHSKNLRFTPIKTPEPVQEAEPEIRLEPLLPRAETLAPKATAEPIAPERKPAEPKFAPAESRIILEKVTPKPKSVEPEITLEKVASKPELIEPEITLEKITLKSETIEPEITLEKVALEPEPAEPEITLEKVALEPEPAEPEIILEKIAPKPEPVEPEITLEKVALEPEPAEPEIILEKIAPKPEPAEPEITLEKIALEPEPAEPEITLEKIALEPEPAEPEIILEKIAPKPEPIEPEITLEKTAPKPEPAAEATRTFFSQAALEAINAGNAIMKNYELNEFQPMVLNAWKKIVSNASTAHPDDITGDFASESEVQLYVICDLAQQIAAIPAANLSPDQQTQYSQLKAQLQSALLNPISPENWDCFEGMKRDEIDRTLSTLLS